MKTIYLFFIFLTTISVYAQNGMSERKLYHAQKANPHPPSIDGRCNDYIWQKAVDGDGFVQRDPVEGDPATEKTYFKILYDEKNLYVLIRAYDTEPAKIADRLARRDDIDDSDFVGIILDSYFDRRTGFQFCVNAAGVKQDAVYSDDEDHDDDSWDPVWEAESTVDDSGWVAELRIPFSQLRFAQKDEHTWGMEVFRYIHRKQELTEWQLVPKNAGGFVSYFGHLGGIQGIKVPKRIEILPYSVTKFNTNQKERDNPFSKGRELGFSGGLDGKIGLNGNLTADFTINPDFGQVEADPSEVNLTAYETFFEEKRPFFIEGKNIFQFPLGIGDGDFARETLFYSRRIGRQPHHSPDLDDNEYADEPEQTSILGAAKLSGKTATGWSIGIIEAMTAEESAKIDSAGTDRKEVVEPFTNYFVGRLQKDFREGNSSVGGIFTATNRDVKHSYLEFVNKSAYTGGIDVFHQWRDKTYLVDLKVAFSHIRGHKDALLEAQTSSARYFQRPDADHLSLDSSRTSMSGHGGSFNIGKTGNGNWRYILGTVWRSPGFELNDLGYLRQADRLMQFIWVGYREYQPRGILRRYNINFNQWNGWNFGGEKLFAGGNINGSVQFINYWGFYSGVNREGDGLSTSHLRGGPAIRYEGGWNNWYGIYSDSRKFWQIELGGFNHFNDDKISRRNNFYFDLILKPANSLSVSTGPFYSIRRNNLQYVDEMEMNGQERYIMAELNQKILGIVFRFNYSITPELTIQYYGQPFISAGEYSNFKRITSPRTDSYKNRYHTFEGDEINLNVQNDEYEIDEDLDGITDYYVEDPDFNFKQFRSNLVIRWEYNPGSQIYLIWSQGRTGDDETGTFSFRRDMRDLFSLGPENIFLIKLNHWFSL